MTTAKLAKALKNPSSCTYLSITVKNHDDLDGIEKLENLESLVLNCKCKTLPEEIFKLSKLRGLEIKGKTLETLPKGLKNSPIANLRLKGNRLDTFPEDIVKLKNLDYLTVSSNKINKIPDSIKNLKKLQTLDLSGNPINSLPDSICSLEKLEALHLENCRLSELPEDLHKLKSLHSLSLDKNKGINISAVRDLPKLSWLGLKDCKLKTLPEGISTLKNLQNVSLGKNPFSEFPQALLALKNLTFLYIWNCGLKELPEEFGSLKSLKTLELERNELTKLPDSLGDLEKLTELHVEQNKFTEFPKAILKLKSIERLMLFENQIKELPEGFTSLKTLNRVRMEHNPLSKFPADLSALSELVSLYISVENHDKNLFQNQVKRLPPKAFILQWTGTNQAHDLAREGRWHNEKPQKTAESKERLILTHDGRVTGADIHLPTKRVITTGYDGLRIWDLETGKPTGEKIPDIGLAKFLGDGSEILASQSTKLVVIKTESGEILRDLGSMKWTLTKIIVEPDTDRALALSGGQFKLLDVKTGQVIVEGMHEKGGCAADFAFDGKRIFVAGDKAISAWDIESGQKVMRASVGRLTAFDATVLPSGTQAITLTYSYGGDDWIKLWDLTKKKPKAEVLPLSDLRLKRIVALPEDGQFLGISQPDGEKPSLIRFERSSGKILHKVQATETNENIEVLEVSSDHSIVMTGGTDKAIRLWDL